MNTYISGKITGLEAETARANFESAEKILSSWGFKPVNPYKEGESWEIPDEYKNNPFKGEWEFYMEKCIELLHNCEAIFMLPDWTESRGAQIEKFIAEQRGMKVYYLESTADLMQLKKAIKEVMGLSFSDYTTTSRKQELCFARLIFTKKCVNMGISHQEIAKILNRDRSTIIYNVTAYDTELKYNQVFRELVKRVDVCLSRYVSQ